MDRRSFLFATALVGTQGFSQPLAGILPEESSNSKHPSESDHRIQRATKAAMAMQRRDWEQGVLAQAMMEADDRDRVILLTKAAMVQQTPDGRMGVVVSGGPTDPAMGGAAYAKAAEWTGEARICHAVDALLEWIRHKAPRSADGILCHVFDGKEMWSDGFNCAPPFLAAMGYYDEALVQMEGYRRRLWNPQKRLLAHIWDDGKQQFKDPNFWGGGNGWAAAGLARVIRSLPAERRKDRETLADLAVQVIDGCIAHQRPDGLFHDVVDQPGTFVETNLAQMLAFAIFTGIADQWLPRNYLAHATKMRTGARAKMDSDGFVQGVCSAPDFNRPGTSTEGQSFCIMMEAAGKRFD